MEAPEGATIFGTYKALITKDAYDGDSVWVLLDLLSSKGISGSLDLGFGVTLAMQNKINLECRLYGINAPEMNARDAAVRAKAVESRDYLRSLIPRGSEVLIDSYGWDKYAPRFDGVIYLPADPTQYTASVNQKMLAGGYAVPAAY